jgi:hypothetical protein
MEKVLRAWNCSMQIAFLSMEWNHRLNMELDLQSLFWPLCTAVPHWQRPRNRSPQPLPPPPAFGLKYEGAIGQPR